MAAIMTVSVAASTAADEITRVPGHQWVTVKNLTPIENGNGAFEFGHSCSINRGGVVTKLADSRAGHVLVRYDTDKPAYGAMCPSGTVFEISAEEFSTMTVRADAADADETAERERIARLIGE